MQTSFAVTATQISVFVFAIRIVQFLYYLNPKFQASSHLLWLYSPLCVGPGRKPRRPVFLERGSSIRRAGTSSVCLTKTEVKTNWLISLAYEAAYEDYTNIWKTYQNLSLNFMALKVSDVLRLPRHLHLII